MTNYRGPSSIHYSANAIAKRSTTARTHSAEGLPLNRTAAFWLFMFAWMALSTSLAHAQSTFGSIRGTVQDTSGAVIPGAAVTIHSLDENFVRDVTSNDLGDFAVENLKAGHYKLTVHRDGFADAVVESAALEARQDLRIPITLSIATEATVVQVSAAPDAINTESGTLSDSKNNQLITQMPLNNRATTTSPLAALSLSANVQQDSSGNIALSGASSSMVNFSVDGISTANVRQNGAFRMRTHHRKASPLSA